MRSVSINVPVETVVNVIKVATKEVFVGILAFNDQQRIDLNIALRTDNDEDLKITTVQIMGDMYNYLMSASPDFAPNKPENEYREIDLWYVVDKIREEVST